MIERSASKFSQSFKKRKYNIDWIIAVTLYVTFTDTATLSLQGKSNPTVALTKGKS